MSTRSRSRAFSALEMVVAAGILAVALMLAGGLLEESFAHVAWAGNALTTQIPEQALEQLRADVHGSSGGFGGSDYLMPLPLVMTLQGRVVTYELAPGGRLERAMFDPLSGEETRRPVLDQVSDFRWRRIGAGLEVEIQSWRRAPPQIGKLAAGGQTSRERISRTDRVIVGPRRVTTSRF